MHGIDIVGAGVELRRDAGRPRNASVAIGAREHDNALPGRRAGIDRDVDGSCVRAARDVDHPLRVDRTGADEIANPSRFRELIGVGQKPCKTGRLRSGDLAFADATLCGQILYLERLPAFRLIRVQRALIGQELQHTEEAGDVIQEIAVGVPEIEQRQFLD